MGYEKVGHKTRALIIRLLVEGNSIRATSRIADVSKNTVNKLLIDAGINRFVQQSRSRA